jgi:hypothetical protein
MLRLENWGRYIGALPPTCGLPRDISGQKKHEELCVPLGCVRW